MTLVVTNEEETDDGSALISTKKYLFTVTDPEEIETIIEEEQTVMGKLLQTIWIIKATGYDLVEVDGVENWVADGETYRLQDFGGYASGKYQLSLLANGDWLKIHNYLQIV